MRRGVTLVELLVVLAVLAVAVGASGLGFARMVRPPDDALAAARDSAIRTGQPVRLTRDTLVMLFLPDGRALGSGVDPLTGGSPHGAR